MCGLSPPSYPPLPPPVVHRPPQVVVHGQNPPGPVGHGPVLPYRPVGLVLLAFLEALELGRSEGEVGGPGCLGGGVGGGRVGEGEAEGVAVAGAVGGGDINVAIGVCGAGFLRCG